MPLYEYQCDQCGSVFEVMQKFADTPLTIHENCGGHVHRLLSAPALQFKGTGWYITDYARGGSSKSSDNGGKSSESKGESSKSEKKSDSSSSGTSSPSSSSTDKKS
jgi:putative FmdB family regulatory protein